MVINEPHCEKTRFLPLLKSKISRFSLSSVTVQTVYAGTVWKPRRQVFLCHGSYEPRREKTGLRGFRPGPTQTDLYSHRKELEA